MNQYVAFYLENDLFGVDIHYTLEVNELNSYTPVPGAYPGIRGLLNLRGEIVTVFDMKKQLGFDIASNGNSVKGTNIIMKNHSEIDPQLFRGTEVPPLGSDRIGFTADRVRGIVQAEAEHLPSVDPERFNIELIESVCRLGPELLMILDLEKLLSRNGGNTREGCRSENDDNL